jgi:hypothetical protein
MLVTLFAGFMASIDETAIVSVRDSIKVRWPSDEYPERKATIIQVQRSELYSRDVPCKLL